MGGGESDVPACGTPVRFSVHLTSSAVTPAGSVHKSRGDNLRPLMYFAMNLMIVHGTLVYSSFLISFAHIECYSDCSHRGSHLIEPLCYDFV